jgi:hypothetical protein
MKATDEHDDQQPKIPVSHDELACAIEAVLRSFRNSFDLPVDQEFRDELLNDVANEVWLTLCRRDWELRASEIDELERLEIECLGAKHTPLPRDDPRNEA